MPKRVAITIAGAVSLGSYEAGVLYELLRAIRTHNDDPATTVDNKIYIDVLTGASAGAMTAAMVAERLMYSAADLDGEFTNVLYQAWVEQISLMGLVKLKLKEKRWHSLFSSDLIESIGRKMLIECMTQPGSGPHNTVEKVSDVPQSLRVGLAVTNLSGIDYMIPIAGNDDEGFNYTTSADQKRFEIKPGDQNNKKQWEQLCDAAVGSGAFPVAFRPKAIDHDVQEYGIPLPEDKLQRKQGVTYVVWAGECPRPFAHSDGGVLQNQPLGIAKDLVDEAVAERATRIGVAAECDSDDRLYVFVSPHSVSSTARNSLKAEKISIAGELKQLVNVYLRQATYHDWIGAEAMNQKITRLDRFASQLADVITQGIVDPATLAQAANDLNLLLMQAQQVDRVNRLREQYSVKYAQVKEFAGDAAAEAFITAVATLEAAGALEDHDKMKIVAVIASEDELAGAGLAAFAGFFRKKFREHDYRVGRMKTRKYLQRNDVKGILGVTEWPEQKEWAKPLEDQAKVKLPVSGFSLIASGFVPALIMILIRPLLVVLLFLVTALVVFGGHLVLNRLHL
jgi:tellurite resistance protein